MFSRLMLAALLLPGAATAQRLDFGLSGGIRQSFSEAVWPAGRGGFYARQRATSATAGLEASYTFRPQRLRLSTGVLRGELAQAFDPTTPIDGADRLELRTTAWQVPLRLHTQLFRLGHKAAFGLRNGLILQLQPQGKPRVGGDYEAGPNVDNHNTMLIARRGRAEPAFALYSESRRKSGALLLETGAEFSYALTPALTLDLSASYQAGLRQIESPELYYLNEYGQGTQRLLTAGTKGSNLLVGLTARYALKTWGGS